MGPDDELAALVERCRADHRAWINGDASGYSLPEHGTILGGIGGWSRGGAETAARQQLVAAQWTAGEGTVELVAGAVHEDVAWLVLIERATVRFQGEDQERRWDLRVTEVFDRVDGAWLRVHRHADPLVDRHPLPNLAALLDPPPT